VPLVRLRLECVSSSAASFGTTSGGGGGGGEFGGGGGGSNGGDAESNSVAEAVGAEEAPVLSPDVIILDVGVRSLKQTLTFLFFYCKLLFQLSLNNFRNYLYKKKLKRHGCDAGNDMRGMCS